MTRARGNTLPSRGRVHALAAGAALTLAVAGVAWAAVPGGNGVIDGCYANDGQLRVIDQAAGESCRPSEQALSWNQVGPEGPQGETGAAGPVGPEGPSGPTGDAGASGPEGPTGPAGQKGDPGDAGVPGPKGETGDTGSQGSKGDTGPAGPSGGATVVTRTKTQEIEAGGVGSVNASCASGERATGGGGLLGMVHTEPTIVRTYPSAFNSPFNATDGTPARSWTTGFKNPSAFARMANAYVLCIAE